MTTTAPSGAKYIVMGCWKLNEPESAEQLAELRDAVEAQVRIPGIVSVEHGPRTKAADWDGPDKDYDYAMIVRLSDIDAVRAYPSHPLHQQLIGTIYYVGDGEIRWFWLDC